MSEHADSPRKAKRIHGRGLAMPARVPARVPARAPVARASQRTTAAHSTAPSAAEAAQPAWMVRARDLRRQGWSVKAICRALGVDGMDDRESVCRAIGVDIIWARW